MGKWFQRGGLFLGTDDIRHGNYKCKETLMPRKTEKTAKELYEEWLDGYIANGGKVQTTENTMPDNELSWTYTRKPWEFGLAVSTVVSEDGVITSDAKETFIVEKEVYVHVEDGCKARICYMEDFSLEEGSKDPIVYGDNPQYGEVMWAKEEKYRLLKEEEERAKERKHQKALKEFDVFAKKVKSTQNLGICKDMRHACHNPLYNFRDSCTAEREYPKTLIISHLPKKTTICSGDKNYSMTIYVTPQAYLKIEKDTGTGTIVTVSDEVAAALVGEK